MNIELHAGEGLLTLYSDPELEDHLLLAKLVWHKGD
jgi:hypothetical protein